MMKVYLVGVTHGQYDCYQDNILLAFTSDELAQKALEGLEEEHKKIWALPGVNSDDVYRAVRENKSNYQLEYLRLWAEYIQKAKEIIKIYPQSPGPSEEERAAWEATYKRPYPETIQYAPEDETDFYIREMDLLDKVPGTA